MNLNKDALLYMLSFLNDIAKVNFLVTSKYYYLLITKVQFNNLYDYCKVKKLMEKSYIFVNLWVTYRSDLIAIRNVKHVKYLTLLSNAYINEEIKLEDIPLGIISLSFNDVFYDIFDEFVLINIPSSIKYLTFPEYFNGDIILLETKILN